MKPTAELGDQSLIHEKTTSATTVQLHNIDNVNSSHMTLCTQLTLTVCTVSVLWYYLMSSLKIPSVLGGHSPVIINSNSQNFPGISLRGINIYYTKPPEVYKTGLCVLPSEYCGCTGSPSCACQLYLTVLRLSLFCDYRNCSSTAQANHNVPDVC